ncbi:MAG: 50S ribosomal protein L22 [bacterium]|nr:50S ribosomal protein L22 [bacterium]
MSVQAIAKGIRMSPRKVSEVAALVRNRTVEDALTILDHTPRRAAKPVYKVIASAKANAEYNHNYKGQGLFIKEITVTAGDRLKRFRPAARGGANKFEHKSAIIRVTVDGELRKPKKPAVEKKIDEKKSPVKKTTKKESK